jgi:hypothetical protein
MSQVTRIRHVLSRVLQPSYGFVRSDLIPCPGAHSFNSLELNIYQQILSDIASRAPETQNDLSYVQDLIGSKVQTRADGNGVDSPSVGGHCEEKVFMVNESLFVPDVRTNAVVVCFPRPLQCRFRGARRERPRSPYGNFNRGGHARTTGHSPGCSLYRFRQESVLER